MQQSARIEEEFKSFIKLGVMMNEEQRRLLSNLLFWHFFDPGFDIFNEFEKSRIGKDYPNWGKVILKLSKDQKIRKLTINNEDFSLSVTRESVNWLRNTYLSFQANHAFVKEEKELKQLLREQAEDNPELWLKLLNRLKDNYPQQEAAWKFYSERIFQLTSGEVKSNPEDVYHLSENRQWEAVRENILNDWEELLSLKKQEIESAFLSDSYKNYSRDLDYKIQQLNTLGDLIAPYYSFFGHAWNNSLGSWERIEWEKLADYGRKLQRDPNLQEIAEILGRWHICQKQANKLVLDTVDSKPAWQPSPYGKSEIIGIHQSDQLSAIIPSEIALLSQKETEIIFSKKFVEKKLLTFRYRSRELSQAPDKEKAWVEKAHTESKGPIIICVDTSGSMYGEPERVAKALAFGILDITLREERKAFLISFSTAIQTLEMTGVEKDFSRMLEFLQMSFHGGTDLQPALLEAVQQIENGNFEKADVMVISDFVIPYMGKKLMDMINQLRRHKGIHFHSLFITRRPDPRTKPLPIFDNHWIYDLDNPRVIRQTFDHFQELKTKEAPHETKEGIED